MSASRPSRSSLVLMLLLGGCFSEVGSTPTPSDTDPTTPQTCTTGSLGCECYGNGSCDEDLECIASISMCVPADCEPGSHQCVCDGGNCRDALVCVDGLCLELGSDTTIGEPTTATGDHSSTSPVTEATTDASTTESASGTGESSEGSTSESTTGPMPPDCQRLSCSECVTCVAQAEADCADEAAACDAIPGCMNAAGCLANCATTGLCLDLCCEGLAAAVVDAADALNVCRGDSCIAPCDFDYFLMACP